jgi:hypothetical protein
MQPMYYIGLDVHKRKISYCVKDGGGRIHAEGSISATRLELDHWKIRDEDSDEDSEDSGRFGTEDSGQTGRFHRAPI